MIRGLRSVASLLVFACCCVVPAAAHPLGNFTINHLAKFTTSSNALHVRYILDIAEIPSFQIMHAPGAATWDDTAMQQWANAEISTVQQGLQVDLDGKPLHLQPLRAHARLRPGAGGLPIIRWVGEFTAPTAFGIVHHVAIVDRVYADRRIGWKDIIAGAQTEPTDELRRYPSALIGTPRRVDGATFTIEPNAAIADAREQIDATPMTGALTSWVSSTALSDMFSRPGQTPLFVLLTILAAFGLGALHAVEPGHGKALLAFTLVGARATSRQALILAASLTFAHTAGVLLLGIVLFFASGFVSESIYPWITLLSGIAIAVIGARSLAAFIRMRRGAGHSHAHEHTMPLNFRAAVIAAMSGGIAPCPAAIVVLLAALRLHQVGYGTLLIVIFSMGLAAVLSGLGIGVVHGSAWLSRRSTYTRFVPYGPLVTAVVISTIGALTLATGLVQQGVTAPTPLLVALTLAAIVGYAVSQHGHVHSHGAGSAEVHV